jgi:hypothetical protein
MDAGRHRPKSREKLKPARDVKGRSRAYHEDFGSDDDQFDGE